MAKLRPKIVKLAKVIGGASGAVVRITEDAPEYYCMANIVPATPPIAAPTKNVVVMVLFTWMPSSALIVWFCDTQRIAPPTFVRLISSTNAITSTSVSTGVISVTTFVLVPNTFTVLEIHGITG